MTALSPTEPSPDAFTMSRNARTALIAVAVPITVLLLGTAVFAMDRATNGGEVLGNVIVEGVELGGFSEDEARQAILSLEDELATTPLVVMVADLSFTLDPAAVGLDLDEEVLVEEALAVGREGGILTQFGWWLRHFGGEAELVPTPSINTDALTAVLTDWETRAIQNPPFHGAVRVEGTEAFPDYPHPGTGINRDVAEEIVLAGMIDRTRAPIQLPTVVLFPELTPADIDFAVLEANGLLSGPVTLARDDPQVEVVFPTTLLAKALRSRVATSSPARLELFFDPLPLNAFIAPLKQELEFPPRDAQIVINEDDTVKVVPGRGGVLVDDESVAEAVLTAARSVTRTAEFPYRAGAEPEFTTEDALALGITRKVSEFSTRHRCCEARVTNIHLIADAIDGVIVLPGEEFSVNDHVGQRTEAKGYLRAGAIINGELYCCDKPANVGGGVSQFGTTIFNAIFFGGYEIIDHT
ncbi:MAG: VanW family protein, partial [Acidimicrobiia bacterium]